MSKYLKILLFSLMVFMGCEELKGPVGPAGADGTANMHVEVIQMTSVTTQFFHFLWSVCKKNGALM